MACDTCMSDLILIKKYMRVLLGTKIFWGKYRHFDVILNMWYFEFYYVIVISVIM